MVVDNLMEMSFSSNGNFLRLCLLGENIYFFAVWRGKVLKFTETYLLNKLNSNSTWLRCWLLRNLGPQLWSFALFPPLTDLSLHCSCTFFLIHSDIS